MSFTREEIHFAAETYAEAKSGVVFLTRLDRDLRAQVDFDVSTGEDVDRYVNGNDLQAPQLKTFLRYLDLYFVKGALQGYIDGHHHAAISELITHLCARDYKIGTMSSYFEGSRLFEYLLNKVIAGYLAQGLLRGDAKGFADVLSHMADPQVQEALITKLSHHYDPNTVFAHLKQLNQIPASLNRAPSATFFASKQAHDEEKGIKLLSKEVKDKLDERVDRMFSL